MARLLSARTLMLGGLAVAAAAGALKNRSKVAGLLGARSGASEPSPAPWQAPVGAAAAAPGPSPAPEISNVDAAGPPENTATHVPAPEPVVHDPAGGIDEEAEEEAAAAEAANIGGPAPEYPGERSLDAPATDAERPLEEAGEGYSEGAELSEYDLELNAEAEESEGERQIEDAIEEQDNPFEGETLEVHEHSEPAPAEQPTVEQPKLSDDPDDDDGTEWQTWSGRAVEP